MFVSSAAERIIVALDLDDLTEARRAVRELRDLVRLFKVGLELFSSFGPEAVAAVREEGAEVFLDLKLHDIPRTAGRAARAAARLGVSMLTAHISGGREMLEAVVAEAGAGAAGAPPQVLGVTVLTSLTPEVLAADLGVARPLAEHVVDLALLGQRAGLAGVVAAVAEAPHIRKACGPGFLIVTPGIRPPGSTAGDQKRVATPKAALAAGADYLVVGRPVLAAADRREAVLNILAAMEGSRSG